MSIKLELIKKLRPVLRTRPYNYQLKGIWFLEKKNGRALLCDDMGLGKTLQVIGFLALHPDIYPIVVVCPSNAKYVWEGQIEEHTKYLTSEVLEGRTPYEITERIVIINYEILPYWSKHLLSIRPKGLIIDECHKIKTRKIKRTKACQLLAKKSKYIIPLSGTPIISKPIEFYNVLKMVAPKTFRSFWKFAFYFCAPKRGFKGRGWNFNGASRTNKLHKLVKPLMLRRMKSEVLTELPPKQRILIEVDLSNRKEYTQAQNNFLQWYKKKKGKLKYDSAKRAPGLVKIGQLKLLAAKGKISAAIEWIDDYLEDPSKKLVIFCHHKEIAKELIKRYKKISAIGGQKGIKRKWAEKKFQKNKKIRLFIGKLGSDKEAITLTAADAVLFIEMGWSPGEHDQAEDRIHRIGQKADSVTAYYLLGKDTIDTHIWDLIETKRKIVSTIMDGKKKASKLLKKISIKTLMKNMHSNKGGKHGNRKRRKKK